MALDLPIIRLTRTSDQNVRLARDPLEASMTLYTFLRSVPTRAEQQYAMDNLRRHASGYYRDSHAEFSSFGARERTIQQLEAAVFDGLLRYPAAVSPDWCRAHRAECLRPLLRHAEAQVDDSTTLSALSSSPGQSPSGAPRPSSRPRYHDDEVALGDKAPAQQHVPASDLKQFVDPYTAFERDRRLRASPLPTSTNSAMNTSVVLSSIAADIRNSSRDEDDDKSEGSTSSSALRRSGTRRPADRRGSLSARSEEAESCSKSLTPSTVSSLEETSRMITVADAPADASTTALSTQTGQRPALSGASDLHPVMDLLLRQVRRMNEGTRTGARPGATTTGVGTSRSQNDAQDSTFLQAMTSKLDETAARVRSAQNAVHSAAEANVEARSVWCTSHAHYKAAEGYVDGLRKRLDAAARLFYVQRHEQETVQAAHLAVALEVTTLDLLLRDVHGCMDGAAKRLETTTAQPAEALDAETRRDVEVDMACLVELKQLFLSASHDRERRR